MRVFPVDHTFTARIHTLEQACAAAPWSEASVRSALSAGVNSSWLGTTTADVAYLVGQRVLDEAEIHVFGVHPAFRRRHLARSLLEHVFSAWAGDGVRQVHLEVRDDNHPARALYERVGFRESGRRLGYYGDVDALLLRRDLCG